jgi:hypothetical protein
MITSGVGEQPADCQPGVSRANNDGVDAGHEKKWKRLKIISW